MLTERPIHTDLRQMLLDGEPFQYGHLIKFERPSRPLANGKASTSSERYTYLTDASRDVDYDDQSTNLAGVANGTQSYLANKVLKIGAVSEQTEAKASNYSLTLDGNGIGAYITGTTQITAVNSKQWDVRWSGINIDLIGAGFREGDKVDINGIEVNIINFRANNTIRVGRIDQDMTVTGVTVSTMTLASEEIKSILLDKNEDDYASFINREVYIYRGYFQEGIIVGAPVLLFRGIISDVSFEDQDSGIQVTWGLTSQWGDFAQVKGRITSDDFHRALDQNGNPQPQSALKPAYAYDKGFAHAETSINMLATYSVQVEKQKIKSKKGFLGIGAKVKVKKYYVTEKQNTDLDFQLQAKSIPVIYGVRNVSGIPVFADTKNDNSSEVYIAHALSEGEIGGIYDIYVNGNSLICNDKADFDARAVQTSDDTVELICRGRSDRGDVLGGTQSTSTTTYNDFYASQPYLLTNFSYNLTSLTNYAAYVQPTTTVADGTGKGVFNGMSISLTSPMNMTFDVFSGKAGQKASSQLVSIAQAINFKIQNDYWKGTNTAEYWGPNHRLLDTAYVLGHYTIADGETQIPDIEYIVRGKTIDCYNYDYSYSHDTNSSSESAANFLLGDMVDLIDMSGNVLNSNTQIIDKWTFTNADGSSNIRYRWDQLPLLGIADGVPSTTKFRMRSSSGKTWTMVTFNYTEYTGTVGTTLSSPLTGAQNSGGKLNLLFTTNSNFGGSANGGDPVEGLVPSVSIFKADGTPYTDSSYLSTDRIFAGNSWSSNSVTTKVNFIDVSASASAAVSAGTIVVTRNTIKLPANASGANDAYNGYKITLTRYNASNDKQIIQVKEVIDYNGTSKIATINDIWDPGFYPQIGDTVTIIPKYADSRISINPAMQTMDYITSTTYGKGLDPYKDLNLPSWLESGRFCDQRSNMTILTQGGSLPGGGQIYRYPTSGPIIWQGTALGSDANYVEFSSVLGKLTNKWNSWKTFNLNEIVYNNSVQYIVTTAGVKATEPTHGNGTVNGLQAVTSIVLNSSNGGPALTLANGGNPVQAMQGGNVIPGYGLYDSDGVDYYRLVGWDEHAQRYVTRHQTNLAIDTSQPLFDNMNSMLEHFGGILRYSGGQYYLEVEDSEGLIEESDSEVRNITADHIIGKIQLSDGGIKNAFNSLTAAYADPANKFEARNISFFNSTYLVADRNVPKKGNVSVPGITNYYNTRILADKYLNKSRFGLTVSFNMAPRGLLLLSGKVVQVQYSRYGWSDKKFRISTLTHQPDGTVDIVAAEYDDSFYILSKLSKQAASGLSGVGGNTGIGPPSNLTATSTEGGDESYSAVKIAWTNNPSANAKNVYTELYSSFSEYLHIRVDTIQGNVLTSTVPHELHAGELIKAESTIYGLQNGSSYYIASVPSPTTFTLSANKGGEILGLTDGTSVGAIFMTASIIATQPVPANSYVDPVGGINGRVTKFYWVRHKVIVQG